MRISWMNVIRLTGGGDPSEWSKNKVGIACNAVFFHHLKTFFFKSILSVTNCCCSVFSQKSHSSKDKSFICSCWCAYGISVVLSKMFNNFSATDHFTHKTHASTLDGNFLVFEWSHHSPGRGCKAENECFVCGAKQLSYTGKTNHFEISTHTVCFPYNSLFLFV